MKNNTKYTSSELEKYLDSSLECFRQSDKKGGIDNYVQALSLSQQIQDKYSEEVAHHLKFFADQIKYSIENPVVKETKSGSIKRKKETPVFTPENEEALINLAQFSLSYASKLQVIVPGMKDVYTSLDKHRKTKRKTKIGNFQDMYFAINNPDLDLLERVSFSPIPCLDYQDEMSKLLIKSKIYLENEKYQHSRNTFLKSVKLFRKHKKSKSLTNILKFFGDILASVELEKKPKENPGFQDWLREQSADFGEGLKLEMTNFVNYETGESSEPPKYDFKRKKLEELIFLQEFSKTPRDFFCVFLETSKKEFRDVDTTKESESELEAELKKVKFGSLTRNYNRAMVALQEANEENGLVVTNFISYCEKLKQKIAPIKEKYKPFAKEVDVGEPTVKKGENGEKITEQKFDTEIIAPEIPLGIEKNYKRLMALGRLTSTIGYHITKSRDVAERMRDSYKFFSEEENSEVPTIESIQPDKEASPLEDLHLEKLYPYLQFLDSK